MNRKIKKLQLARFAIQIVSLALTIAGLWINDAITLGVLLGITIVAGPVFCGWICPYGLMQELISKFGKFLGIRKIKMPKRVHQVLIFSRYILFACVLLVTSDFVFSMMIYDPRVNFTTVLMGSSITILGWIIVVGFLIMALFFERPFCNYICTEGARYGLFGILRPLTIQRNEASCVNCGKCDQVCPMNIEVSGYDQVRSLQCINCMACVEGCPVKNTLTVGVAPLSRRHWKRLMPIVCLAALFIGIVTYNSIAENQSNTIAAIDLKQKNKVAEVTEVGITEAGITEAGTTEAGTTVVETTEVETSETETTEVETTEAEATQVETTETETTLAKTTEEKTTEIETTELQTEIVTEEFTIQGDAAHAFGDAAGIPDGVYSGSGIGFRRRTTVVDVTVKDEIITDIVVTQTRDDAKWFIRAYDAMASRIIEAQSTDVDTVSGATYSSIGIRDAVADALD